MQRDAVANLIKKKKTEGYLDYPVYPLAYPLLQILICILNE